MKKITIIFIMFVIFLGWITKAQAQTPDLTPFTFPEGADPETLATAYAHDFATRTEYMINNGNGELHYADILAAASAINFAHTTHNEALFDELDYKYRHFFNDDWEILPAGKFVSSMAMFAFYKHNDDPVYRDRAYEFFGNINTNYKESGELAADGMYFEPTIHSRFYLDDGMDPDYLIRLTQGLEIRLDFLLEPNGLIRHKENNGTWHWARGMGWASGGLANSLQIIPEDHPRRAYLMESYLTMMTSLIDYQTENGLWRQLINLPAVVIEETVEHGYGEHDNFEETSGTSMFTYAMITGVRMGWLDEATFRPVIEKAWLGLVDMINEDGELTNTCLPTHDHDTARDYLRPFRAGVGDYHAQAAFLWVAEALIIFNEEANVLSTDDNNIKQVDLKMYPNPAQNENVTIKIANINSSSKVSLYDITGKAILHYPQPDSDFEISTSNLTSGIYFVKLINQSATITKKLIIG